MLLTQIARNCGGRYKFLTFEIFASFGTPYSEVYLELPILHCIYDNEYCLKNDDLKLALNSPLYCFGSKPAENVLR